MALFLATLSAVAGCVSTGIQVTDEQLSTFAPGETTRQEVIKALGNPTTQMRHADGTSTIVYNYIEASARPETYFPFVGAFIGGADSRSSMVTLRFDADGRLLDHSSAESSYGAGTGFRAGQTQRVVDQPKRQ